MEQPFLIFHFGVESDLLFQIWKIKFYVNFFVISSKYVTTCLKY